ncbi:ABC transporter ATP-binding protein [Allorhizobium sp. BGMRC 0089]|uniref:ABC transporter ATP-binding protein n=1 Tax=Allorhizobium sonneratiae TaxID=2934936 RepID=UPI002033DBFB|nr:ABC transporter ATP-binding protein [Allorhizobium sonneratiae]MCM2294572.1 ABC transporter ATP-binding protein [Allorhizobium sonneratiae]
MNLPPTLAGSRPAAFTVEALHWGPHKGETIIEDISFSVRPGEMLAITGPNGAGKSSLLRCLYRFLKPSSGTIKLDGTEIGHIPPQAFARRVASVLQEQASDFGLSVAEIVELGASPHMGRMDRAGLYQSVEDALSLLGLAHLAARDFALLSGGEKQRVMIARALAQKPDLLILDEPTNHLDIRHQLEVLELLSHVPATVIVTLHDLALACAHADHVLVLSQGRQVSHGPALQVLTPEAIRRTFAVETTIDSHPMTGRPRFSFHLDASF